MADRRTLATYAMHLLHTLHDVLDTFPVDVALTTPWHVPSPDDDHTPLTPEEYFDNLDQFCVGEHIPDGLHGALTYFAAAINLPAGDPALTVLADTIADTRDVMGTPGTAREHALTLCSRADLADDDLCHLPTLAEWLTGYIDTEDVADGRRDIPRVHGVALDTLARAAADPGLSVEDASAAAADLWEADVATQSFGARDPLPGLLVDTCRAFTVWDRDHLTVPDGHVALGAEEGWTRLLLLTARAHATNDGQWGPARQEWARTSLLSALMVITCAANAHLPLPDDVYALVWHDVLPGVVFDADEATTDAQRVRAVVALMDGYQKALDDLMARFKGLPEQERFDRADFLLGWRRAITTHMHTLIDGTTGGSRGRERFDDLLNKYGKGVDVWPVVADMVADGLTFEDGWEEGFLAS